MGRSSAAVLGERVRAEREERGLSGRELAERAGVSLRTLQRIEAGYDAMTSTVVALANALGVPVSRLLTPPVKAAQ